MEYPSLFIVILGLILILYCFFFIFNVHRQREIVFSTSQLISSLLELNKHYHFHDDIKGQYRREKELSTKQKFDRYNCEDLFDRVVFNEYQFFLNVTNKLRENSQKYEEYSYQVMQLQSTVTEEITAQTHISYRNYKKIETELFQQYRLTPIINSDIVCIATYTSPQGRNRYSKEVSHPVFEVRERYQELQKDIAYKNSEQAQRKRERSKMSPSLRYDILRRDGFKCQICGRTQADGIKLHVDHIIPVAKGGKSKPDNLRTLCDQCNLGKSDKAE